MTPRPSQIEVDLMPVSRASLSSSTDRAPDSFQRYYEEAGPDYAAWSAAYNMHFGFFRRGLNPFNRESMLEEMNRQVFDRLHLVDDPAAHHRILDMGCGLGATLRSFALRVPAANLYGITLVPWQLEQGRRLNQSSPHAAIITLNLGNYESTGHASASFDAVCAIESSCYSSGANKSRFIRESHRLIRPGGRIVIADGFLGPGKLHGPQRAIYSKLCDCWAIESLGEIKQFTRELERVGFRDIVVEQIQSHVAPSVLHIPIVTLKFLLTSVVFGRRKMTRARWNNVLAPMILPFVGYPIGPLAYYLISATRI